MIARAMEISNELASAVLNEDVIGITLTIDEEPTLKYHTRTGKDYIGLHFFSNKCKEWAYYNGYLNATEINIDRDCDIVWTSFIKNRATLSSKTFEERTEPEAIFLACQWILDNKEK